MTTRRIYRITTKMPSITNDDFGNLYVVAVDAPVAVADHEGNDHGGLYLRNNYADYLSEGDEIEIENLGESGCVVYRDDEVFYRFDDRSEMKVRP